MEKFRKCRFADVGKSELGKKKHAQNIRSTVHRTGDLTNLRKILNLNDIHWIPLLNFDHFIVFKTIGP